MSNDEQSQLSQQSSSWQLDAIIKRNGEIDKCTTKLDSISLDNSKQLDLLIARVAQLAQENKRDLQLFGKDQIVESKSQQTRQVIEMAEAEKLRKVFCVTMNKWKSKYSDKKDAIVAIQKRRLRLFPLVDDNGQATEFSDTQLDNIINRGACDQVVERCLYNDSIMGAGETSISSLQDLCGLRDIVADLEDRHRDILLLERQVLELLGLFKDLDVLVDVADEKLEHIDNNIQTAAVNVGKAEVALKSAEKSQKKCCGIDKRFASACLCILMPVIILLIIFVSK